MCEGGESSQAYKKVMVAMLKSGKMLFEELQKKEAKEKKNMEKKRENWAYHNQFERLCKHKIWGGRVRGRTW